MKHKAVVAGPANVLVCPSLCFGVSRILIPLYDKSMRMTSPHSHWLFDRGLISKLFIWQRICGLVWDAILLSPERSFLVHKLQWTKLSESTQT